MSVLLLMVLTILLCIGTFAFLLMLTPPDQWSWKSTFAFTLFLLSILTFWFALRVSSVAVGNARYELKENPDGTREWVLTPVKKPTPQPER